MAGNDAKHLSYVSQTVSNSLTLDLNLFKVFLKFLAHFLQDTYDKDRVMEDSGPLLLFKC